MSLLVIRQMIAMSFEDFNTTCDHGPFCLQEQHWICLGGNVRPDRIQRPEPVCVLAN